MFDTHPPLEDRIATLEKIGGFTLPAAAPAAAGLSGRREPPAPGCRPPAPTSADSVNRVTQLVPIRARRASALALCPGTEPGTAARALVPGTVPGTARPGPPARHEPVDAVTERARITNARAARASGSAGAQPSAVAAEQASSAQRTASR